MVTSRQRNVVWIWIALIVAACICPPWRQGNFSRGYGLIFAPPRATVDFSRLALEWVAITAVFAGLYFAWPSRNTGQAPPVPPVATPRPKLKDFTAGEKAVEGEDYDDAVDRYNQAAFEWNTQEQQRVLRRQIRPAGLYFAWPWRNIGRASLLPTQPPPNPCGGEGNELTGFLKLCHTIRLNCWRQIQGDGGKNEANAAVLKAAYDDYERQVSPWLSILVSTHHGDPQIVKQARNAAARCLNSLSGGFLCVNHADDAERLASEALDLVVDDPALEKEIRTLRRQIRPEPSRNPAQTAANPPSPGDRLSHGPVRRIWLLPVKLTLAGALVAVMILVGLNAPRGPSSANRSIGESPLSDQQSGNPSAVTTTEGPPVAAMPQTDRAATTNLVAVPYVGKLVPQPAQPRPLTRLYESEAVQPEPFTSPAPPPGFRPVNGRVAVGGPPVVVARPEEKPLSILDAENAGFIRTSYRSPEGSSSGDSVLLILVKIGGPDRLVLTIPPGLLLKSPLPASQNMIIAGLKGRDAGAGKYTPASTITLTDTQPARYVIEAYCAEFHKDNPPADKFDFSVGTSIDPEMACVLSEARTQGLSVAGAQAAVWIHAEHVTFSEMNTRMPIGVAEWARAEAVASRCASR